MIQSLKKLDLHFSFRSSPNNLQDTRFPPPSPRATKIRHYNMIKFSNIIAVND